MLAIAVVAAATNPTHDERIPNVARDIFVSPKTAEIF
ncbi:hypothetical protein CIP107541_00976 [Corynebacterium diphtheriae]|nr:hypothetical protein CIP107541_00976 [Corynebacterium diphtheriae]